MVAPIHAKLGMVRPLCLARPMLFSAQESLEAGYIAEAGVKLLEAVRRYVTAMCQAHEITPAKSLRRVVRQLTLANQLTDCGADWLLEAIDRGDQCLRCERVQLCLLKYSITCLHLLLDHSPELDQPNREGGVV